MGEIFIEKDKSGQIFVREIK